MEGGGGRVGNSASSRKTKKEKLSLSFIIKVFNLSTVDPVALSWQNIKTPRWTG